MASLVEFLVDSCSKKLRWDGKPTRVIDGVETRESLATHLFCCYSLGKILGAEDKYLAALLAHDFCEIPHGDISGNRVEECRNRLIGTISNSICSEIPELKNRSGEFGEIFRAFVVEKRDLDFLLHEISLTSINDMEKIKDILFYYGVLNEKSTVDIIGFTKELQDSIGENNILEIIVEAIVKYLNRIKPDEKKGLISFLEGLKSLDDPIVKFIEHSESILTATSDSRSNYMKKFLENSDFSSMVNYSLPSFKKILNTYEKYDNLLSLQVFTADRLNNSISLNSKDGTSKEERLKAKLAEFSTTADVQSDSFRDISYKINDFYFEKNNLSEPVAKNNFKEAVLTFIPNSIDIGGHNRTFGTGIFDYLCELIETGHSSGPLGTYRDIFSIGDKEKKRHDKIIGEINRIVQSINI